MDYISKYYVAKQVEIRHSINSEWPLHLKQALKHPHIDTQQYKHLHSGKHSGLISNNNTNIALEDRNEIFLSNSGNLNDKCAIIESDFCDNSKYVIDLPKLPPTITDSAEQNLSNHILNIKKSMTSYVTSRYTLGSFNKSINASSNYERLISLKDVLHQLIRSHNEDLEVILITNDFAGILKPDEVIITKCTNQFRIELDKSDLKISTFYDLIEKEYKRTDLYRKQKAYSQLNGTKMFLSALNLPNSTFYTINTMYFKASNATHLYNIILKRTNLALDDSKYNSSFSVEYIIANFPVLYCKICNNKINFDDNIYFDSNLSVNFKRTIIQGYLTPEKLFNLYTMLIDLERLKLFQLNEIRLVYDNNLMKGMHEKSLHIEGNRIFQNFTKNESEFVKKFPWLSKFLKNLTPRTRFTLTKIDAAPFISDEVLPLADQQDVEVCYLYTHSKLKPLIHQLILRAESDVFKIKVLTEKNYKSELNNLSTYNIAAVELYNKWAYEELATSELPKLRAHEYISKLWVLYVLNHKKNLKKLLFQFHPLRQISTFTYSVKNIRINHLYKYCLDYDTSEIKFKNIYSHVDWTDIDLVDGPANDFYQIISQKFTESEIEVTDKIPSIIIICVSGNKASLEEWDNYNITKMVFDFDCVQIVANSYQWDLTKQFKNTPSVNHILTKLSQLDEFNFSSFNYLFKMENSRRYYQILHISQFDTDNLPNDLLAELKESIIIILCLSNNVLAYADGLRIKLIEMGLVLAEPVNMGWIYDCYHYGLIDYKNSLNIHRGVGDHKFSFWGWTFFITDCTLIKLPLDDLRRSQGIEIEIVDSQDNLSQAVFEHFLARLEQFGLDEGFIKYLGSDVIYTRYIIFSNFSGDQQFFRVKIADKLLVTLGDTPLTGIRMYNETIESLIDSISGMYHFY